MPETSQTRLQLLQARIRLLNLDKLDAADRQVLEDYLAAADETAPATPAGPGVGGALDPDAKLAAEIVQLVAAREQAAAAQVEAARAKAEAAATPPMGLVAALQTPPFYFFFGLALLGVAFVATQTNLNSSLTFLVAILGVAIVLYGTGSQAAGTFGNATEQAQAMLAEEKARRGAQPVQPAQPGQASQPDQPEAQGAGAGPAQPAQDNPKNEKSRQKPSLFGAAGANVAIAGGAAAMAAFFGWGVIERSGEIRQVFRDFDQYVQLRVYFCDIAAAECRKDGGSAQRPDTDTGINSAVRSAIAENAYIETGTGQRAYAREIPDGLEFVLFDRELGAQGRVRLMAQAFGSNGAVFNTRNDPFDPHNPAKCLGWETDIDECALWTDSNRMDLERVRVLTLRAAIIGQSKPEVTTDSFVDVQAVPVLPN